jgi:uncharacterized protein HemY
MGMRPRLVLTRTAVLVVLLSLIACGGSLISSARRSLVEGRYTEAEDFLNQRLAVEPGDGDAHLMLGMIALQRQQTEKAREHFELAKIAKPALKTRIEEPRSSRRPSANSDRPSWSRRSTAGSPAGPSSG